MTFWNDPDEAGARLAEDAPHAVDVLDGDEDGHVVEGAVGGRVVAALVGGEVLVDIRHVPGDDAFPPELRLGKREQLVAGVLAQVVDGDVVAADVGRRGQELEWLIDRVRTFDRGRQMVYSSRSQDPGAHSRDAVGVGLLDLVGDRSAAAGDLEPDPHVRDRLVLGVGHPDRRRRGYGLTGGSRLTVPVGDLERGGGADAD